MSSQGTIYAKSQVVDYSTRGERLEAFNMVTFFTDTYETNFMFANDKAEASSLPSLPTVLREKFGLLLKPQTAPVDVLVIDHVEKPSPN